MKGAKHCCPTCGHPMLPRDPLAFLPPMQRRIFDLVYASGQAGISWGAIFDRAYAGTTGGVSRRLISAHVHYINTRIAPLFLRIESSPRGPLATYKVIALPRNVSPLRRAA